MREFYIFEIKDTLIELYLNHSKILFQMLRQIYFLDKKDVEYAYYLIDQLICPIDYHKIDQKLFLMLHQKMAYSKKKEKHIINDLFKDEISVLTVKRTYFHLETNKNYSTFLNHLSSFSLNYFVCDFKWNDYFFLSQCENTCIT